MRRNLIIGFIVVLAAAVPVLTVTNGQLDGEGHPYVGLAFQPIPSLPGFVSICSGSAISPTVFLTAAHCFETDPANPPTVIFKSGPPFSLSDFIVGTFVPHPDWCFGCGPGLPGVDTHDVAVIVLNTAVTLPEYANLPAEGLVDTLAMRTPVTLVGYGVQSFTRGGGQPSGNIDLFRHFAPTLLVQSNHVWASEYIKLTANPAADKGGVCFGDSGGPDVLEGTGVGNDTVLAVNSYVTNSNCTGVTYSNRIDLEDILGFITGFLD